MDSHLERIHARRAAERERRHRRRLAFGVLAVLGLLVGVLALAGGGDGSGPGWDELDDGALAEAEPEQPVRLTLSFSGDLLIHSPVFERALAEGGGAAYDFVPLLREIRPFVARADLAFCHLEVPMGAGLPSGYPLFNSPPELASAIHATGWDACDTASNHSLDKGAEGIQATLEALDEAGVRHTGSAESAREARRLLILEAGGARVAYLAYTSDTNGNPMPSPHAVNLIDRDRILSDANRARRRGADAVIVNIHWGATATPEYVSSPSRRQRTLAAFLTAEKAITAVVGQGPHVVQPIKSINGKPVVYSEGNLISNQGADVGLAAASQDGLIALLHLRVHEGEAEVTRVRYVPVWVDRSTFRVLPATPDGSQDGELAPLLAESYARTVATVGRDAAKPVGARP